MHLNKGDLAQAEKNFNKSEELRHQLYPDTHPLLIQSTAAKGRLAYARKQFKPSLNLFNEALASLARLARDDQELAAELEYEKAQALRRTHSLHKGKQTYI